MDPLSATFTTFGCILLFCSWLLLLQASFDDDFTWGLCTLLLPPLSYLYGLFAWNKAKEAIGLSLLGWVLLFIA